MTHNIRKTLGSLNGEKRVVVSTVYGELGSGLLDKNGVEVFNGDLVAYTNSHGDRITAKVFFRLGAFWVCDPGNDYSTGDFSPHWLDTLPDFAQTHSFEVVGHADD